VFDICRIYAPESKTAAYLESVGCVNASRGGLEQFWKGIGFEVVTATELLKRKGKSDPGDGLPIDEDDEWSHIAYVLRKG